MILAVPLLFFLVYICSVSAASGVAAYYIDPGETYMATLDGRARKITNATSYTLFVPVRTLTEQQSFLNNLPAGVTALTNACEWETTAILWGTEYPIVGIGNQCWMAKNIAYLPSVVGPGTVSITTPYYYVYGYDGTDVAQAKATTNYTTYGVLYNWPAALTACPTGWHLPTDIEWNNLEKYVVSYINSPNPQYPCSISEMYFRRCADNSGTDDGGTYGAGKSLKKVGQGTGVGAGDDLVGFGALLAGEVNFYGDMILAGSHTYWWTSTINDSTRSWARVLYYQYSTVSRVYYLNQFGFSVRCVRD